MKASATKLSQLHSVAELKRQQFQTCSSSPNYATYEERKEQQEQFIAADVNMLMCTDLLASKITASAILTISFAADFLAVPFGSDKNIMP